MYNVCITLKLNVRLLTLDLRLESGQRHRFHQRIIYAEPAWSRQYATVHLRSQCCINVVRLQPLPLYILGNKLRICVLAFINWLKLELKYRELDSRTESANCCGL